MGPPVRIRRPPGHDPTSSTPRNQVRQVDKTRSDCNRNNRASPSHGRTRCNAAPRHLRRREPGACHSTSYRVHIPQKALTRLRLRPGSQPALQFFRHRADMIPLIHVVVDILVSITYVLVDIYYFYCPLSRISTTQDRHRSGAARAEAPLRQAATPRNWLRGRCVKQPVLSNKEIPLGVPDDRPGLPDDRPGQVPDDRPGQVPDDPTVCPLGVQQAHIDKKFIPCESRPSPNLPLVVHARQHDRLSARSLSCMHDRLSARSRTHSERTCSGSTLTPPVSCV